MPSEPASLCRCSGSRQPGAGGAADHGDHEPVPHRRVDRQQLGGRAQHHVGRLERLDPADEQQHDGVVGDPEPTAGRRRVGPGAKTSRSTPGATVADPRGLRVVELDELRGLVAGRRDQPVGRRDDLGLTDRAQRRLGAVALGQRAFFTLAMVCMVCTSGTPQRSLASQPTWPDSQ